ncbi:protein PHLOEM PROTEIN 2-LIKE A9-like [Tripterygium wilfordii]|uniref:Protein PHLOEM PROTEIN 2-LIKE A9-like n=1 Tax=Tripterygium wilfordii TaxID=458696 RepID=A0A7J7C4Z4_TRIWF|nr:protein PHLOEM PROTEIN 2-LIKE A9-like [Tripterygium wilfordii]
MSENLFHFFCLNSIYLEFFNHYMNTKFAEFLCREPTVLELVQVCWLEVTGSTTVEAGKKYQVSFTVSLKPDAFGWNGCPVFMMAKVGRKGKYSWKKIKALEKADFGSNSIQIPDHDGNKLVIEVEPTAEDRQLYFGLYEVWSGKWKGGLEIHNAIVRIVS